jgi:hypothetical protein
MLAASHFSVMHNNVSFAMFLGTFSFRERILVILAIFT